MRPGLIEPDALADAIDHPALVLLDASLPLPGETYDAEAAFHEAHLPRARRFDVELFSDPEAGPPHMAPSAGRFARLAGELGIDAASDVVVYDQRRLFASPRAWWLFRLFGHDRVRVLDGGLPAWVEAGHAIESGPSSAGSPTRFVPRLRNAMLVGLGDLVDRSIRSGTVILDARSPGRFEGTAPEPRPRIPSGHIPGSRNVPFGNVLNDDGSFLSDPELRALFAARGIDIRAGAIATCGTGITAATLVLAMFTLGAADVALYDGSWTEYAASGLPIETATGL